MIKHIFSAEARNRLEDEVFNSTSDRACAIVAGSVIETALKTRLVESLHDRLFKGGSAVIGTFSAKIDISLAIGSISESEHHNLHIVRKIRNHFAHEIAAPTDFEESPVRDFVDNIRLPKSVLERYGPPRRQAFRSLFLILFQTLERHRNTFPSFTPAGEITYGHVDEKHEELRKKVIEKFGLADLEEQAKQLHAQRYRESPLNRVRDILSDAPPHTI